jgi:hypothetical protein
MVQVDAESLAVRLIRTALPDVTVNVEYAVGALTSPGFLECRTTDGGETKRTETVSVVDFELIGWSTESRTAASQLCARAGAALRLAWLAQTTVPDAPGSIASYRGILAPIQIRLGNQPSTVWRYRAVVSLGVRTPNDHLGV